MCVLEKNKEKKTVYDLPPGATTHSIYDGRDAEIIKLLQEINNKLDMLIKCNKDVIK